MNDFVKKKSFATENLLTMKPLVHFLPLIVLTPPIDTPPCTVNTIDWQPLWDISQSEWSIWTTRWV